MVDTRDATASGNIVLRATLGGVITGRVFTEFGRPAPGLQVRLERASVSRNGRQVPLRDTVPSTTTTDEVGDYRLAGLPAGVYLVAVIPRETSSAVPTIATPDRRLIDIAERISQKGSGSSADWSALAEAGNRESAPTVRLSPTYAPGVADPNGAMLVRVSHGATRSAVDIHLSPARSVPLEGRVIGVDGAPITGSTVVLIDPASAVGLERRQSASTDETGRFRFASVPPGNYRLVATEPPLSRNVSSAEMKVIVQGQPVPDMLLSLSPGHSISGVVAMAAAPPRSPALKVRLERADIIRKQFSTDFFEVAAAADGSFRFEGIPTGRYRLSAFASDSSPERWRVDIRDYRTDVLDVGPGLNPNPLSVLTHAPIAGITGMVAGSREGLPSGLVVLVVPENEADASGPPTISTVGADGAFQLGPLRQGRYRIGVIWYQPGTGELPQDVVDNIREAGRPIDLTQGAPPTLTLTIGR